MLRFEIATWKAFGALAVGSGSRWLDKASAERPHFVAGLTAVLDGKIVPVASGVLFRNEAGDLLGAEVLTGGTSDNDEAAAVYAIEKTGLPPQPA